MGYDYEIQYRSGTHNQAADALSRLSEHGSSVSLLLSVPSLNFLDELRRQLEVDPAYMQRRNDIRNSPATHPELSISGALILRRGRIWLPQNFPLIPTLLIEFHATPTGGHAGVTKTLARISENFYWEGLRADVTQFVAKCVDCHYMKYETKRPAGLLCPLPVPHRPWDYLSLDFIVGLPPFHSNTVILVVVDRFSKGVHLGMLPQSHTAYSIVVLFTDIIVKLHGVPQSLVSDRDPLFVSKFWQDLFKIEWHPPQNELRLPPPK